MRRSLSEYKQITTEEMEQALDFAGKQILHVLPQFTDHFEKAYSENGFYKPTENTDWTTGFWTGEIWLAYEHALRHPEKFSKEEAEKLVHAGNVQVESFLRRIDTKTEVDHHDMGFLYSPSCVAAWKLLKNEDAKEAAIKAADQLLTRFQPVGGFLQAWGPMNQPENYRLIIDCLNNLPLLYWASKETGNEKYEKIADIHIHTALSCLIREDYSTWHTYFFNMKTGEPDHGATCQGYRDGSAWARGQAWGVYGLATAYKYTGKKEYIDLFERVTEYFMDHLPEDLVPFWDLEFNDGDDQPRDSSSAGIAACGMLEMARYLEKGKAEYYIDLAKKIMKSVWDNYAVKDFSQSNGLVLHSTYSNHSPYNTCNHYGVDECNIWGDYFYMEALTRLSTDWRQYW